jgi:hypothetical protein
MRQKINYYQSTILKLHGPIFRKKINIEIDNRQRETELFFYVRDDGALIVYHNEIPEKRSYKKSNRFILKLTSGWPVRGVPDFLRNTFIYKSRSKEGVSFNGRVYKYNQSSYHTGEYLKKEYVFLNALEVKLVRAARDRVKKSLGLIRKKETKDENA